MMRVQKHIPTAADWGVLPRGPATFVLPMRLSRTTVRPFREPCGLLQPSQSLKLVPRANAAGTARFIQVETEADCPVGAVYADVAGWLLLLLDTLGSWKDHTEVISVQTGPRPGRPDEARRRYPVVFIRIVLDMPEAWPLYTIAAMIGFRSDDFSNQFNLAGNPFLQPLMAGYRSCCHTDYDAFRMPPAIIETWRRMTWTDR